MKPKTFQLYVLEAVLIFMSLTNSINAVCINAGNTYNSAVGLPSAIYKMLTGQVDNGLSQQAETLPSFRLFVWMKNGEKTGYLLTDKPKFSLEDDVVRFSTDNLSLEIDKDEFEKFSLEKTQPNQPTDIALTDKIYVGLGRKVRINCQLTPTDAQTRITWLNSNPNVVSVDKYGNVEGLQIGTATLKAQTSNGLRAECLVTVNEPLYRFYVWLRDGSIDGYAIEEKPSVEIGEELFTLSTTETTVSYAAKDVLKFTLNDSAVDDPASGIYPIRYMESDVMFRAGEFIIYNGRAGAPVMLYDIHGRLVSMFRISHDGTLRISINDYLEGIYLVRTEKSSYKIIKK